MPSRLVKWCLTATAISPALGAAAIIAFMSHDSLRWAIGFTIAGLLAALISLLVVEFVKRYVQREPLKVTRIEKADQKMLEFLLAYLLPVFSGTSLTTLAGSIALTVYSLLVVMLVVVHGNMFQFNPMLAVFGYHFYVVESDAGIDYLVISRKSYHRGDRGLQVKKIAEFIYLDVAT